MTIRAERLQPIEDVTVIPSPSWAAATLLHTEEGRDALLVLRVMPPDGGPLKSAIVTAVSCRQSVFGYPDDEAWSGDPRGDADHPGYGFYEVLDSTWPDRLATYNRRNFPGRPLEWGRHFLVTCHDASAQFLAQKLTVEIREDSFEATLGEAVRRLWQE
ncbi:hypothetical protein [Actinacidiphila acididurans]|uniref:Uncharacterized protein n=1 Tax=Actinacidiphila acididurans TaxID=2784346 RepID=A0ABS2TS31_9ACTN|nr:hypothetical protein [Actinacidiphila acididurans]MBM9506144.1 hypothetical protein [Actinacidiphila acididurans]